MLRLNLNNHQKFLAECIHHRDFLNKDLLYRLFCEIGEDEAYNLCEKNHIISIAYDSLNKIGIPLSERWYNFFNEVDATIKDYMEELDLVAKHFLSKNIRLVALKNSGITRGLYQIYGASPMGDLDVLIEKLHFKKAHHILLSIGYKLKFRSELEEDDIDLAELGGGAEYCKVLKSGRLLWFELQWRPVAGRMIRIDIEPNATDLIDNSQEILNSYVRILSPEDNLLQVALHTAKHSYVRSPGFRLHTDVDRIVRSNIIDWDLFIEKVKKLELKTSVFFSLALARELLDTPIPLTVLNKIMPSKFKVKVISYWLQSVGLFNPDDRKWNKFEYIIFVSLLYDGFGPLIKNMFPNKTYIKEVYGLNSFIDLFSFYFKRIFHGLTKRSLSTKK